MGIYKRFALRGMLVGAAIAAVFSVGAIFASKNQAQATSVRDCDSNAAIYCGALSVSELQTKYDNSGDAQHHYADLHNLYNYFGITSTGVHSLSTKVAIGQVHSDGTVWLNGKLIGQNAVTAGRISFPGSTPVPGTNAFMRSPSVSFRSPSINAYIGFENGVPAWAILDACGNPVKWDRPVLGINKKVQDPKTGTYAKDASFQNGSEVHYSIDVGNVGKAAATNVIVGDALPVGQNYVKGSTTVNGAHSGDGVTGNGINVGSLAVGSVVHVKFTARVSLPAAKCGVTEMTNTGAAKADNFGFIIDTAKTHINVSCISQCTSLSTTDYDIEVGQKLTLTASAIAKGVTITGYTFKVNGVTTQTSSSSTYVFNPSKVGDYNISVVVKFSDGSVDGGKGTCAKKITVHEKPAIISCDSLTASKTLVEPNEIITFSAVGSAKNAKILSYIFKVDGVTKQDNSNNVYKFSSDKDGTFQVSVVVHTDHGDATSNVCTKKVDVQTQPKPIYRCDLLTVNPESITTGQSVSAKVNFEAKNGATFRQAVFTFGDEASAADKFSTNKLDDSGAVIATHTYNKVGSYDVNVQLDFMVDGKVVSVNDDACHAKVTVGAVLSTVTPPASTLPNTGSGDIFGIFAITSITGTIIHRFWTRRFAR